MIFFWDGLLPPLVALTGPLMRLLIPHAHGLAEIIAVALPIGAFFARLRVGRKYFESHRHWKAQIVTFYAALFLLALLDAVLILFRLMPEAITRDDWFGWALLYGIYLSLIAVATFPRFDRLHSASQPTTLH